MALDDETMVENTEPSIGDSLEVSTTIEEPLPLPVFVKRKGNAYWNLLKTNGPYRLLVLADILDLSGRWLSYLAILSIVETISDSALALSGLLLVQRLPPTIMYPFVGVVADRFDRRRIMIITLLLEMIIVLGFVGIYYAPNLIMLYLLCWIQSSVDSFFQPARAGLVPCYVKGPDIIIANAIDGSLWSSCLFMGAAIGGFIAQLAGPVFCFVVDASTYAIAASLLMFLYRYPAPQSPVYQSPSSASENVQTGSENEKEMESVFSLEDEPAEGTEEPKERPEEKEEKKEENKPNRVLTPEAIALEKNLAKGKSALSQFLFGLSFMAVNPNILILALIKFLGAIVWGACSVAEVKLAESEFVVNGSSFTSLAILYAMVGIGTGISPVVAERLLSYFNLNESVRAREMAIIIGYLIQTIGAFFEGWSPNIFVFFAGCCFRSSGGAILWVFSTSLLQQWVDNKLQGRVFAFDLAAATLGEGLSTLLGGLLMDEASWSPRKVCLMYGSVLSIIIFGSWLAYYLLLSVKLEKRYFDKYPHLLNQHNEETGEIDTSTHGAPISPEIAASQEDGKDLIL